MEVMKLTEVKFNKKSLKKKSLKKKSLEILEDQLERELQDIKFKNDLKFKRERGKPIRFKKI